jgi:FlaA1/EpsC-like NDP-sugar epimerase
VPLSSVGPTINKTQGRRRITAMFLLHHPVRTILVPPSKSYRTPGRGAVSFKNYLARYPILVIDSAVLCAAYCAAVFLCRGEAASTESAHKIFTGLGLVLLVQALCLLAFQVPNLTWRYVSVAEFLRVSSALWIAAALLGAVSLVTTYSSKQSDARQMIGIPFNVLFTDLSLGILSTTGLRVGVRLWSERSERNLSVRASGRKVPTVLIGAGSVGAAVVKELVARPDGGIDPIGFLDDDPKKQGMVIHGLAVLGGIEDLEHVVREWRAEQALITLGRPSGQIIRRVLGQSERCGITTKIIPDIFEIINGAVNIGAIRDVAVEDLLRREPVTLDNQAIAQIVTGQRVVVTGAGGSIGSALCHEVCTFRPELLVLIEQAENSLFHVTRRLRPMFPDTRIVPCIADVCDTGRMRHIFAEWRPSVVLHAAAHKHVPLMEENPGEAIKNNVVGTKNLADAAHACDVKEFVMISTDKAINPTSVMGVSKRIAEIYIQAMSQRSQTRFITVRFGNVLNSAGSVIPIFKEQIAKGGPVTVTHPDMKRYFMTIQEACQLVLQAASMGQGGEIFILDMGEPVKIVDLARDLIRLSGRTIEEIGIQFVGMRPGEKLFEELSLEEECVHPTKHPKVFIGRLIAHDWDDINRHIHELHDLAECEATAAILGKLKEIVPEYDPSDGVCAVHEGDADRGPRQGVNGVHRKPGVNGFGCAPLAVSR